MRGPVAAMLCLAACGGRPAIAINNRTQLAQPAPALRDRPDHAAVPLPARAAARFFALATAPPIGTCGHGLFEAWHRGPEALLVHAAELADTGSACAATAAPIVARLALTLDRDRTSAAHALAPVAWNVAASLASTPASRRVALRNAAEAAWRLTVDRRSASAWRDVARAFAAAAEAGDRDAVIGELDAWHNALTVEAAQCAHGRSAGPLSVIPAARARAAVLGPSRAGDRLRAELASAGC